MTGIRRVVTGYGPDGRARVVSDEQVKSISPDHGDKWSIWAADEPPRFPGDGAPPPFRGPLLPAPGGFHITVFTLPANFNPDDLWGTDDPALREQLFKASTDPQSTRHSLAYWTGAAGDMAGPCDHFAELLPIQERVLGPGHPDTLATQYSLTYWGRKADHGAS
jgi:hypothetical protein